MVLSGRSKLQGTVEVDEVFVGGKKPGKRERGTEGKSLVAVAVEITGRKTGRMRLTKIPNASSESLHGFIEDNIEKPSKVITDRWLGYNGLSQIGYEHQIQESKVKDGDEEILPNVHRIASLLKRWLLGRHLSYLNKNKLEYYLDEYVSGHNAHLKSIHQFMNETNHDIAIRIWSGIYCIDSVKTISGKEFRLINLLFF